MTTGDVTLAVCLAVVALSALALAALSNPDSRLSRLVDGADNNRKKAQQ